MSEFRCKECDGTDLTWDYSVVASSLVVRLHLGCNECSGTTVSDYPLDAALSYDAVQAALSSAIGKIMFGE